MNVNEAKWLEGFAKESLSDQFQTIAEDLSCLDILVAAALECERLAAELAAERAQSTDDAAFIVHHTDAEITRLAARVAGLEAVLRSIEWGGKCGELFVVEICPACGGSVEHEQGCALDAAKGAEHE